MRSAPRLLFVVALAFAAALPAAAQILAPSTAPRDMAPATAPAALPPAGAAPATPPARPAVAGRPVADPGMATGDATIPALTSPVIDTTGTLDAQARSRLEQQALALQQRKGSQLQILIVPTTRPEEIEEYAVRAYTRYRLGREKVDDGVLIVVAKEDRRARIEVGYGLEGAIPDAIASRVISEYMMPRFRTGDYAGGLSEATRVLTGIIDGEPLPAPAAGARGSDGAPSPMRGNPILALIAAYFVAQMVRGLFGRMPAFFRGIAGGLAAGAVALMLAGLLFGAIGGLLGFFLGLAGGRRVRYARDAGLGGFGGGFGGFGGGGFGGGGFGGGGGWSGGGGMSGGGGASGSW